MASICGAPVCAGGKPQLKFTYTGDYVVRNDGVVELHSSGTLVFLEPKVIDVFCVGGGGGGGYNPQHSEDPSNSIPFGGGGGGYTRTVKRVAVLANGSHTVVIGAGGTSGVDGNATAFDNYSVNGGGKGGTSRLPEVGAKGGNGGSGGGGGASNSSSGGDGGSNGENGTAGYPASYSGGTGQSFTTKEFGEETGKLYSGGGGGGRFMLSSTPIASMGGDGGGGTGGFANTYQGGFNDQYQAPASGVANTGGGGGGGVQLSQSRYIPGASGGSGIVCFRDAAPLPELAGTWVLNERLYAPEKDFDEITGYRFKVGTIECTRIRTSNLTHLSAFKVFSGDTVDIYTFSTNTWKTTARNLIFPAGATASDEFRAWLASNASKQA